MKRFFYREAKEKLLCQPSKEQLLLSLSQVRNHVPLYMSIADDFQAQSLLLLLHCNSQIMVPIDEMEMILMLKRFHPLACRQEVGNESKSCRDVMNHFLGFCCITAID